MTYRLGIDQAGCDEIHRRLDEAGVPHAHDCECSDLACDSQICHRVTWLIAENIRLREFICQAGDTMIPD